MRFAMLLCCSSLLVACAASSSVPAPTSEASASSIASAIASGLEVPEGTYSVLRNSRGEYLFLTPRGLIDEDGFPVSAARAGQ